MGAHNNSPRKFSTTLQHLFDLDPFSNSINNSFISKGIRKKPLDSENLDILSTISRCCVLFSFTNPSESYSDQELKRRGLIQLLGMVKSSDKPIPDQILRPLVSMLSVNLFRPLPASCSFTVNNLPEDEETVSTLVPAWPHLQLVYEILLRLVLNMDPKKLRDYIDDRFVLHLLCLFQSEDPRERERLKNVYHRIYCRFTFYRSFMRKSMNDVFFCHIFETESHCGISEMLEIWGSIINGFTVPLKEEHKLFLMRVLIPLHKTKGMHVYHRQLAYCVSQFVQKEPAIGGLVIRAILRYWPVASSQKEVLLIGELEELVEHVDPGQYRRLSLPICSQIARCLNSWNSQVAERALYVWNNEQFVKMAFMSMEEVFPVVVEGMEKNLKWHWNKSVKQLTENIKTMLEEVDPNLYEKCLEEMKFKNYLAGQEQAKRKQKWDRIESEAAKNVSPF
ncbi:hypothetical protein K2173_012506 [Erythroxylum novogranatense]|uniref:Serine/threonine protein phosphatase 2A regulatory subunit n=1 Tax=Erythroxylum novogranatense TaxID=1862640 RepID=A0AAV8TJH7_9ROSI|nr:hypothetical protein K2173_012506 [Erythroxylum novogranatense]